MKKKESKKKIHFECINPNCDNIINVSLEYVEDEDFKEQIEELVCPKCGSRGFEKLSEEKEVELEKKLKKKAELEAKKKIELEKKEFAETANEVVKYIIKERKKLFDDLSKKLMNKEITPERFISLFYKISCDIMVSRKKEYLPDWIRERKTILDMGQTILDLYKIKEEQEAMIEAYDEKEDEIYIAYNAKYINKKDELYEQYISETRLSNYMKRRQEEINKIEERNVSKNTNRIETKLENNFARNLKNNVIKDIRKF